MPFLFTDEVSVYTALMTCQANFFELNGATRSNGKALKQEHLNNAQCVSYPLFVLFIRNTYWIFHFL